MRTRIYGLGNAGVNIALQAEQIINRGPDKHLVLLGDPDSNNKTLVDLVSKGTDSANLMILPFLDDDVEEEDYDNNKELAGITENIDIMDFSKTGGCSNYPIIGKIFMENELKKNPKTIFRRLEFLFPPVYSESEASLIG